MTTPALPTISSAPDGLTRYYHNIQRFPMLSAEEEYMLGTAWKEHSDGSAAEKLIFSHLRLAYGEARKFSRPNIPQADLVQEANIGLLKAVRKFDPEKARFSSYALTWIRSTLRDFVRNMFSMIKLGTTAAQRTLFSNLRRDSKALGYEDSYQLTDAQAEEIIALRRASSANPDSVNITVKDVHEMHERLNNGAEQSLNAPLRNDGENAAEWLDMQADPDADQAFEYANNQEITLRGGLLNAALKEALTDRQRDIFISRRLNDDIDTLEIISRRYDITRERVRQIENDALKKVTAYMAAHAADFGLDAPEVVEVKKKPRKSKKSSE